jgi:hypothetical protein
MKKLFEKIDIFGYKINFNYRNSNAYNSNYSYIISTLVYIVLIYLINFFSQDMIYRQNPRYKYIQHIKIHLIKKILLI